MRIFLTGATGFLGRHLLARLDRSGVAEVRCLVRRGRTPAASPRGPLVVSVEGDLRKGPPAGALEGCDAVVHLAALTGKASPGDLDATNVEGTRRLLLAAREAHVPRFLHVSTIAVSYPETRHYPYARSKARAELLVRDSGLDWRIVRPTVIFGPGSAVGESLARLAGAPLLPLFGGGTSRVQPVHVTDVAALLAERLGEAAFGERTEDAGGRDVVLFGDLLRGLRVALRGTDGPAVPVPLGALIPFLAALEPALRPLMPVTAGQLYAFRYDAVATEGADAAAVAGRKGVREIVAEIARAEGRPVPPPRSGGGNIAGGGAADEAPDAADRETLEAECARFARHLAGLEASPAVKGAYVRAHAKGSRGPLRSTDDEDDVLVQIARGGPWSVRFADAWAAVFDRHGVLRRKLVLVLAILESGPDSERIDVPAPGGYAAFARALAVRGAVFAVTLLGAAFVIGPRWLLGARGGREAERS